MTQNRSFFNILVSINYFTNEKWERGSETIHSILLWELFEPAMISMKYKTDLPSTKSNEFRIDWCVFIFCTKFINIINLLFYRLIWNRFWLFVILLWLLLFCRIIAGLVSKKDSKFAWKNILELICLTFLATRCAALWSGRSRHSARRDSHKWTWSVEHIGPRSQSQGGCCIQRSIYRLFFRRGASLFDTVSLNTTLRISFTLELQVRLLITCLARFLFANFKTCKTSLFRLLYLTNWIKNVKVVNQSCILLLAGQIYDLLNTCHALFICAALSNYFVCLLDYRPLAGFGRSQRSLTKLRIPSFRRSIDCCIITFFIFGLESLLFVKRAGMTLDLGMLGVRFLPI